MATDTPQNCLTSGCLVVTRAGKIAQGFFDFFATANTWTAANVFGATTSISAFSVTGSPLKLNGVAYAFPALQGAASTYLQNNGAGALAWAPLSGFLAGTSTTAVNIVSSAASTTLMSASVPASSLAGGIVKATVDIASLSIVNGSSVQLCLAYGSSAYCTTVANSSGSNVQSGPGSLIATLYGSASSGSQTASMLLNVPESAVTTQLSSGALSADSTAAQTISVTAKFAASSASNVLNVTDANVTVAK